MGIHSKDIYASVHPVGKISAVILSELQFYYAVGLLDSGYLMKYYCGQIISCCIPEHFFEIFSFF